MLFFFFSHFHLSYALTDKEVTWIVVTNKSVNSQQFQNLSYWTRFVPNVHVIAPDPTNCSDTTKEIFKYSNITFYLNNNSDHFFSHPLSSIYHKNLQSKWFVIANENTFVYPGKLVFALSQMNYSLSIVLGSFWVNSPEMMDSGLVFTKAYAKDFFSKLPTNEFSSFYQTFLSAHGEIISSSDTGYYLTCLHEVVKGSAAETKCITIGGIPENEIDQYHYSLSADYEENGHNTSILWNQYPTIAEIMMFRRGNNALFHFGQQIVYHKERLRAISPFRKVSPSLFEQSAEHNFTFKYHVIHQIFPNDFILADEIISNDKVIHINIGEYNTIYLTEGSISYVEC